MYKIINVRDYEVKITMTLTETSKAIPVQSPSPLAPRKESIPYETRAPKGVEALKKAR